jgi:hypothetical protein
MLYRTILLFKFIGVSMYAGGLVAAFVATLDADRYRAVHGVASPGLLITWIAGYLLTTQLGEYNIGLTEFWILGGLVLSLASQMALVYSVSRKTRTPGVFLAAAIPLLMVLVLMVFRPTWWSLSQ